MKIIPFGKQKEQGGDLSTYANLFEEKSDGTKDDDEGVLKSSTKIDEIQDAITQSVGEPSLDNLMIILAAIGMSQISMKVSQDGSSIAISGIIDFSDPEEEKIGRKE